MRCIETYVLLLWHITTNPIFCANIFSLFSCKSLIPDTAFSATRWLTQPSTRRMLPTSLQPFTELSPGTSGHSLPLTPIQCWTQAQLWAVGAIRRLDISAVPSLAHRSCVFVLGSRETAYIIIYRIIDNIVVLLQVARSCARRELAHVVQNFSVCMRARERKRDTFIGQSDVCEQSSVQKRGCPASGSLDGCVFVASLNSCVQFSSST